LRANGRLEARHDWQTVDLAQLARVRVCRRICHAGEYREGTPWHQRLWSRYSLSEAPSLPNGDREPGGLRALEALERLARLPLL